MNRRLEWFIFSVFDHYFGKAANGKYDGLFYGWDVVNEAVNGNTYRDDKVISDASDTSTSDTRHGSNSMWWRVYKATNSSSMHTKIAYCHKQLFDAIKGLKADGSNVSGLTVWGVIEPNSWL